MVEEVNLKDLMLVEGVGQQLNMVEEVNLKDFMLVEGDPI
jgi:hypothetical protein